MPWVWMLNVSVWGGNFQFNMLVSAYSCADQFLNGRVCLGKLEIGPLKEVVEPEHKRAIIGDTFIHCKDQISKEVLNQNR